MKVVNQNDLQARLTRHFREVLSIAMDLKRWPGEASLPAFLRETYALLAARVLGGSACCCTGPYPRPRPRQSGSTS